MRRAFRLAAAVVVLGAVCLLLTASSCSHAGKGEQKQANAVADQQALYYRSQPIPMYDYSQPRDTLIQIYNAIIPGGVNTYSVFYAFDKPVFVCPSYGFPIPADTQLTNPLQKQDVGEQTGIIEQADPMGLFVSKSTNGTWVLCVRGESGELAPMYWEGYVLASSFPIKMVDGVVVDAGGGSTMAITPGGSKAQ